MPHKNLQEFIKKLESADQLLRISVDVDSELEITEIADRVSKANGPALLFENIKGSQFPLLINAFGSYKRMQMALMCDSFDDIAAKIEALRQTAHDDGACKHIETCLEILSWPFARIFRCCQ